MAQRTEQECTAYEEAWQKKSEEDEKRKVVEERASEKGKETETGACSNVRQIDSGSESGLGAAGGPAAFGPAGGARGGGCVWAGECGKGFWLSRHWPRYIREFINPLLF